LKLNYSLKTTTRRHNAEAEKIPLENTTLKLNNNSKITTRKYNTEAEL
jgi:hypothetical protein